jgi:hypothetical protein
MIARPINSRRPIPRVIVFRFAVYTLGQSALGKRAISRTTYSFRPYFLVAESFGECGHVAFIALWSERRLRPIFGNAEQLFIGAMPAMSGVIVWWCGKPPVRFSFAPVRLTLQVVPMTGCTIPIVDEPTPRDLIKDFGIGSV